MSSVSTDKPKELISEYFRKQGITSLYHFTHRSNVDSIQEHGLLSYKQRLHKGIKPEYYPTNDAKDNYFNNIGDFVHLAFTKGYPKYNTKGSKINMVCISIALEVLDQQGVVFYPMHPRSRNAKECSYSDINCAVLKKQSKDELTASELTAYHSEALIPNFVLTKYLQFNATQHTPNTLNTPNKRARLSSGPSHNSNNNNNRNNSNNNNNTTSVELSPVASPTSSPALSPMASPLSSSARDSFPLAPLDSASLKDSLSEASATALVIPYVQSLKDSSSVVLGNHHEDASGGLSSPLSLKDSHSLVASTMIFEGPPSLSLSASSGTQSPVSEAMNTEVLSTQPAADYAPVLSTQPAADYAPASPIPTLLLPHHSATSTTPFAPLTPPLAASVVPSAPLPRVVPLCPPMAPMFAPPMMMAPPMGASMAPSMGAYSAPFPYMGPPFAVPPFMAPRVPYMPPYASHPLAPVPPFLLPSFAAPPAASVNPSMPPAHTTADGMANRTTGDSKTTLDATCVAGLDTSDDLERTIKKELNSSAGAQWNGPNMTDTSSIDAVGSPVTAGSPTFISNVAPPPTANLMGASAATRMQLLASEYCTKAYETNSAEFVMSAMNFARIGSYLTTHQLTPAMALMIEQQAVAAMSYLAK